jgi:hypothetical protein
MEMMKKIKFWNECSTACTGFKVGNIKDVKEEKNYS